MKLKAYGNLIFHFEEGETANIPKTHAVTCFILDRYTYKFIFLKMKRDSRLLSDMGLPSFPQAEKI